MSNLDASELAPIEEDVQQPEQPAEVQTVEAQPVADEESPDAIEIKPGEKYVPLSAVIALRKDNKDLKAQASKVPQLEQRLSQIEPLVPFAEFVRNNPHLLNQPQAQAPPAPVDPSTDPQLVTYAKRFDLYTVDGKPDVERAKAIIEDHKRIADEAVAARMAPLEHQTNEQRAIANLNSVLATKDGEGNALRQEFITQAVTSMAQGVDQRELIRMLADPKVAQVVALTALGLQAAAPRQKTTPVQTPGEPLHVETAGGKPPEYTITAAGKRMAQIAKIPEKTYTEVAKAFNPNGPNTFD